MTVVRRSADRSSFTPWLFVGCLLLAARLPAASISGFIREQGSGEPIAAVMVEAEGTEIGTLSGDNGYYLLQSIPAGFYVIHYTIIGYRTFVDTVVLTPDQELRRDVRLKQEPLSAPPVVVTAERARFRQEVDVGVQRMRPSDFKIAPGFVEQDLFKSLQILPGVITISDFSSALYVRGGSPDQNLILLDGVEIYSPYHLGGLFSTFSLDALSSAELHSGAFPAEYGNAVSSVLDVEMKEGNTERYSGAWDVSMLSAKALVEGPIPSWRKGSKPIGSFLISGRRTYIDAVTRGFGALIGQPDFFLPYHFYDLQAKANVDLTKEHRLTLSGFFGDDVLNFGDQYNKLDFRWGNSAGNARWRWVVSPSIISNLQLTRGRYRVALSMLSMNPDSLGVAHDTSKIGFGLGISNLGLHHKVDWFPNPRHTLRFGWDAQSMDIFDEMAIDTVKLMDLHDKPWYFALYGADKWHVTQPLWLDIGLRAEYFTGGGFARIAPRLGAKYLLPNDLALKAGYGHFYQYLSIPYPRDEMMMKLPLFMFQQWLPASSTYPPVHATHYNLGAEKYVTNDLNVGLEVYLKTMENLLETDLPLAIPGLTDSVSFTRGTGWATGAELLVKWKRSWFGYNLAYTRRTFEGESFYPVYDTRHTFNVAWGIPLRDGWNVNLQWLLHTGFPYTGAVGRYQWVGPDDPEEIDPRQESNYYFWFDISGRRGDLRYPPYHRLDAAIEKAFRLFGIEWTAYLQVVNVYAQKNVLYYEYVPDENGRIKRTPVSILPFPVPSFGIKGNF